MKGGRESRIMADSFPSAESARNFPVKFKPLTNERSDLFEYFSKVSACFTLDNDRHDKKLEVRTIYPVSKVLHRLINADSEINLINCLLEFRPDRIVELVSHHLQPARECMPGLQRPGDKVKRVGQLFLKFCHSFLFHEIRYKNGMAPKITARTIATALFILIIMPEAIARPARSRTEKEEEAQRQAGICLLEQLGRAD